MKVLFVCNQNENRSKTAHDLFKDVFETKSAGLFKNQFTGDDLAWSDLVLVMEDFQRDEIANRFPSLYMQKQILCLDIPDIYHYNQPELVELLKSRVNEILSTHQIAF